MHFEKVNARIALASLFHSVCVAQGRQQHGERNARTAVATPKDGIAQVPGERNIPVSLCASCCRASTSNAQAERLRF